jgi:cytochrome P450
MPMDVQRKDLFAAVLDPANRSDPYPLYEQLRQSPVSRQSGGSYVVSTYDEVRRLLHDKRISSDLRKSEGGDRYRMQFQPPFIFLDPPDHTRLRKMVLKQFQTQAIESLRPLVTHLVGELLDEASARGPEARQIDVVAGLAYPLPVTVICRMLGVPAEDERKFHQWADILVGGLDPGQRQTQEEFELAERTVGELSQYISELVSHRRRERGEDLISELVADEEDGRLTEEELVSTVNLLLIAGHETTVNLIANGMLTLLRHPETLAKVREDPKAMLGTVEEVLRYDPPVQFRLRTTLEDVDIGGTTIPKGAFVVLMLASGSRDPKHFPHADQFDVYREDNRHFGFGGGPHFCVGAPLARMEAGIALGELVRRLEGPRLVSDPLRYRKNAALRGPEELLVGFDRLLD